MRASSVFQSALFYKLFSIHSELLAIHYDLLPMNYPLFPKEYLKSPLCTNSI